MASAMLDSKLALQQQNPSAETGFQPDKCALQKFHSPNARSGSKPGKAQKKQVFSTAQWRTFGGDWPDAMPIEDLTETRITFSETFSGHSIYGDLDRITGDAEVRIEADATATHGKLTKFFTLRCKPTRRMF
jgi:hypothetical protein